MCTLGLKYVLKLYTAELVALSPKYCSSPIDVWWNTKSWNHYYNGLIKNLCTILFWFLCCPGHWLKRDWMKLPAINETNSKPVVFLKPKLCWKRNFKISTTLNFAEKAQVLFHFWIFTKNSILKALLGSHWPLNVLAQPAFTDGLLKWPIFNLAKFQLFWSKYHWLHFPQFKTPRMPGDS